MIGFIFYDTGVLALELAVVYAFKFVGIKLFLEFYDCYCWLELFYYEGRDIRFLVDLDWTSLFEVKALRSYSTFSLELEFIVGFLTGWLFC